MHFISMNDDL